MIDSGWWLDDHKQTKGLNYNLMLAPITMWELLRSSKVDLPVKVGRKWSPSPQHVGRPPELQEGLIDS